ncbi:TetR/AcrR family transcriptional regulator [Nakamurella flava]|uniref:TetR/AcrR family transcriptional regulator n=1 Tax=Nakamurella flava TaxID=2576308 RepID=A0A4U6QF80_9ACTN|nr:TetR-like C-terminal domain-containing protein [Nakamurella flava]TKV58692.1 TetR/AcrR family transcriptional regulator [Nakamurella flava]
MTATPRALARERTMADILRIGREHLAAHGAAALSLRAVARDLGVVSSAVYRYVASRDELLTLLVVQGYTELGDAVDAAVDRVTVDGGGAHRAQFGALATAVRDFAHREPALYALLFGAPVPGYAAPAERTTVPGTRVVVRLVRLVADAYRAGELREPPSIPLGAGLAADVERIMADPTVRPAEPAGARPLPPELAARVLLVWPALFGAVSWEVFGQFGAGTLTDPAALFDHSVELLAHQLGFAPAA